MSARDDLRALTADFMRVTDPRHIPSDADREFLATYDERRDALYAAIEAEWQAEHPPIPPVVCDIDPNIEYERRRDARLVD